MPAAHGGISAVFHSISVQVVEFLAILFRATLSIGLGYTLQVWGQKHTPPTDAALILGLEAVFAVAAGWAALGQTLLPIQIMGCFIIFAAVILSRAKGWGKIELRAEG